MGPVDWAKLEDIGALEKNNFNGGGNQKCK